MTPLQDHGYATRQHIIHGDEAPKRHYKRLIKMGLSEVDAANMSGWHPMIEFDTWCGRLSVALTIALVVFLLIVLTNNANAMMDMRGSVKSEEALISCMNGEPIRFDNGDTFFCMKVMK